MDRPFSDLSQEEKDLVPLWVKWQEFHFHYENEFGGVRDIEIPFEGVVNNITVVSVRPIVISPATKCALI